MKIFLIILLISILGATKIIAQTPQTTKKQSLTCFNRNTRCFLKKLTCPEECPSRTPIPNRPKAKVCFINCDSPNCHSIGAACYDPRFIGGDGIVFYFHGRSNEHFTLVSDSNLQINARFIGLRPPSNDCFAHMEVQFRFFGLTTKVEGVIGRTYQPDFVNPAKQGVAMPVVGGEDKYKTTSLLSADCIYCIYNPGNSDQEIPLPVHNGTIDCSHGLS